MLSPSLMCACSSSVFFFFLPLRPPPRSTLFPTRRSSDLKIRDQIASKYNSCRDHRDPQEKRQITSKTCRDRKSTRLNSSHVSISYAVFCLKKKTQQTSNLRATRDTNTQEKQPSQHDAHDN